MHILLPETYNCLLESVEVKRMTIENISNQSSLKNVADTAGFENPSDHQSDAHPNKPLKPATSLVMEKMQFKHFSIINLWELSVAMATKSGRISQ